MHSGFEMGRKPSHFRLCRNVKIRLRQQAGFLSPYAFWSIASENGDGNIKTGD